MDNMKKIENLQFLVNELSNSIKNEIVKNNDVKNQKITDLKKDIERYVNNDNTYFKSSYNISLLKNILSNLFLIVEQQDQRIKLLESNN